MILGLAAVTAASSAQSVQYSFSGVGTGSVNSGSFADLAFEVVLRGDLSDIFGNGSNFPTFLDSSATVSIDGLITDAVFDHTLSAIVNRSRSLLVLGDWDTDLALGVMDNAEFDGYELTAPFGPVTDTLIGATDQFSDMATSAGLVSIPEMQFMTFEATTVPAPMGGLLLPLASLIATRRRR